MIPTGRQFREGRLLVGVSRVDLAATANVTVGLVARIEAVDGLPMVTRRDSTALQMALEAAGVEFVQENGGGAGVRLRKELDSDGL